ncbi:hypothetical protein PP613_23395 [Mycobacteroides abscessus]|nr:hypothetical protein [Mycobacteroides abscessus]MDM2412288.1 hypothetical protein [Mycobacteroides abscessus]
MKSHWWRFKSAFWVFGFALIIVSGKTVAGLGEWAWNALFSDNQTAITIDYDEPLEHSWPR